MTQLFRLKGVAKRDAAIDAWLGNPAEPLQLMARPWFERMRKCGSDVRELMADGRPTACVEDAAFGYVGAFRAHVSVGFFYGASLADPAKLLEGAGKQGRHVKLRPGEAFDEAALQKLIAAAYADIKKRLAAD